MTQFGHNFHFLLACYFLIFWLEFKRVLLSFRHAIYTLYLYCEAYYIHVMDVSNKAILYMMFYCRKIPILAGMEVHGSMKMA